MSDPRPAENEGETSSKPVDEVGVAEIDEKGGMQKITIDSFPNEILGHIFSFLNFDEKLEASRVCKSFHNAVASLSSIWNDYAFVVKGNYFQAAMSVLNNSVIPWTCLKFREIPDTLTTDLASSIPAYLGDSVLELVVEGSRVAWLNGVATILPKLTKLTIIHSRRSREEGTYNGEGRDLLNQRITSLKIQEKTTQSLRYLSEQFKELSALTELEVSLTPNHNTTLSIRPVQYLISNFFQAIRSSVATLKSLTVRAVGTSELSDITMEIWRHLVEMAVRESSNEPTDTDGSQAFNVLMRMLKEEDLNPILEQLNLEVFHVDSGFVFPRGVGTKEEILLLCLFLRSQQNLTSLQLPIFGDTYSSQYEDLITEYFPKNLRNVEFGTVGDVVARLSSSFSKLRFLNVGFPTPQVRLIESISTNILPGIASLTLQAKYTEILHFIKEPLPNILKFCMFPGGPVKKTERSLNTSFQRIILLFPNLETLTMSSAHPITDYDVAGAHSRRTRRPVETTRDAFDDMYYLPLATPTGMKSESGFPITALSRLKELTLLSSCSQIGDYGLIYGLDFTDLRKLELSVSRTVTTTGLIGMARLNPNLETVSLRLDCALSAKWKSELKQELLSYLPRVLSRKLKIITSCT